MDRESKLHLVTTCIIIATIAALVGYDVFTVNYAGAETSISRIIILFLGEHPVVATAAGALMGHLTWSVDTTPNWRLETALLGASLVAMVLLDVFHALPPMMPLWPFLVGIPLGHAFWGQCISPLQRLARLPGRRKSEA